MQKYVHMKEIKESLVLVIRVMQFDNVYGTDSTDLYSGKKSHLLIMTCSKKENEMHCLGKRDPF